ncbi:MAG: hypothetical protein QNJ97_12750 [Myxococcota bacterium]|nr:hypothetical protein [Myxococcota bacterium]
MRAIRDEDASLLLMHLERIAATLGINIRYELLGEESDTSPIRSGLCRVQKDAILLIDSRLDPTMQCLEIARALGSVDLSNIFVPPAVRDLIEGSRTVP